MSEVHIVYPSERLIPSFHRTLDAVAKERVYIEMIEAKSLAETAEFQKKLIANHWPVYYAVCENEVVGWADITPSSNPRLARRGFLGNTTNTSTAWKWRSSCMTTSLLADNQNL